MSVLRYCDTRGLDSSRPAFTGVVTRGLADGGGLYVPESLPSVPLSEILRALGALRIVFYGLFLMIFIVALPEGVFHYIQRKYHQFERWVEVEK